MDLPKADCLHHNPDIHQLFCHYNSLYFEDALGACIVSWSSQRKTATPGVCHYLSGGGCEIRLSEPLLKFRSTADLKNILLHEMIHAYLWITNNNEDHNDHGQSFQRLMEEINSSTVVDHQRPAGGYNITVYHSLVHQWMCQSCGDLIMSAMNRAPSAIDCFERIGDSLSCGSPDCPWHKHKMTCSGTFKKIAEASPYNETRGPLKGEAESLKSDSSKATPLTRSKTHDAKAKGIKGDGDIEKVKTIDSFFHSVDRTSPHCESHHQDHGKPRQTVDLGPLAMSQKKHRTRVRTDICKKRDNNYNVIIEWIGYYSNEVDEEVIEPLLNKRTERRKRQKLGITEKMEKKDEVKSVMGDSNTRLEVDDLEVSDAYIKIGKEGQKRLLTAKSYESQAPCPGFEYSEGCFDESAKTDIVDISDG
ncbi:hypothetical protein H6P81_002690 [Aristolochia fimbriata]|uniref:SprT-like domain-containing protein n=1 Tax=Aristolochia fimbriata TaxID=158543 RepID=A0AAV7FAG1_ARIFI|nr:hypothetical protein H6P81_002690 [Aristolochia fimbriata]